MILMGNRSLCEVKLRPQEPEVAFLTSTIHDVLTSHCSDRDCKAIFLANSASKIFSQVQALTRRAVEQLGNHADVCQDKVADDSPDIWGF
eukprot:g16046.t1